MSKAKAAAGTIVFLVVAPGVVAGLIPWWLTGWDAAEPPWWPPVRLAGVLLLAGGVIVLLHAFARFVSEGVGTPAPVAPTERLVVGGLYRWIQEPHVPRGRGDDRRTGASSLAAPCCWPTRPSSCRPSSPPSVAGEVSEPAFAAASAMNTRRTDVRCPAGGPVAARGSPTTAESGAVAATDNQWC